jgi:hypothetical protein
VKARRRISLLCFLCLKKHISPKKKINNNNEEEISLSAFTPKEKKYLVKWQLGALTWHHTVSNHYSIGLFSHLQWKIQKRKTKNPGTRCRFQKGID